MNRSAIVLALAYAVLSNASVTAQEADSTQGPFSEPPRLLQVLHHNFDQDDRNHYKVRGDVVWNEGSMTLRKGASLELPFKAGSWARITVDLAFDEDHQAIRTRLGFKLTGATDCRVEWSQSIRDGKPENFLRVLDAAADDENENKVVKEFKLGDGSLSDSWTVSYRFGVIHITSGGSDFTAYIKNDYAVIDGIVLESERSASRLDRLTIDAVESIVLPEDRRKLLEPMAEYHEAMAKHYRLGDYSDAIDAAKKILATSEMVFGKYHPNVATAMNNVATVYGAKHDFANSEPLYLRLLAVEKAVLGESHPSYGVSVNNYAMVCYDLGDYRRAEELFLQALRIRDQFGMRDGAYAIALHNLSLVYEMTGQYGRSIELEQQASEIVAKEFGEETPEYASCQLQLGKMHQLMGNDETAERLIKAGLETRERIFGKERIPYAKTLNRMGALYEKRKELERAEQCYREAYQVFRKHAWAAPSLALTLNNLARLSKDKDPELAEKYHKQAMMALSKTLGEQHPLYGTVVHSLAKFYEARGELDRALEYYRVAESLYRKIGEFNPDYALTLYNLAGLHHARGELDSAFECARRAVQINQHVFDDAVFLYSEQEQIRIKTHLNLVLHRLISVCVASPDQGRRCVDEIIQAKGATFMRQRQYRTLNAAPDTASVFQELRDNHARLAKLTRNVPEHGPRDDERSKRIYAEQREAWNRQLAKLTDKQKELERVLAAQNKDYGQNPSRPSASELLELIPSNTALIDYYEFVDRQPDPKKHGEWIVTRKLVANVLRNDGKLDPVLIGSAPEIRDAISVWRQDFGESQRSRAAAEKLRRMLWDPIRDELNGVTTVLISPDGALGTLPFGVLPGDMNDRYLVEDYRLAVIPVPQLLPSLLRQRDKQKRAPGDFLLIGGVDYGSKRQRPKQLKPRRRGSVNPIYEKAHFEPLEFSASEVANLKRLYEENFLVGPDDIKLLAGQQATEAAYRQLAPQFENLHISTHGFFADAQFKSHAFGSNAAGRAISPSAEKTRSTQQVDTYSPGLLSGLALSGANGDSSASEHDGILTAFEIAMTPLQQTEMVVLPACDTGLGLEAGGEGLIGVQRSFQVAGAKSTVATLWKVDDAAAGRLMAKFYENLWEKQLPRIDALREAQLWMLRSTTLRGSGGIVLVDKEDHHKARKRGTYASPMHWGAFTLAGDWR